MAAVVPAILLAILLTTLHSAGAPSWAAPKPAQAPQESAATAVAVTDGDTLTLDSGREVRLVGIQAPKLPLGRKGFAPWPMAPEAKETLERLALGSRLRIVHTGAPVDRHGRLLAHLYTSDGTWLQEAMLRAGMARVYSFADNRALVAEMLAAERAARDAGRGIWALRHYRIRTPVEAARDIGSFQIVEGKVVDAAVAKGTLYLNFGHDWKTDFTARIPRAALSTFHGDGATLAQALTGRTVRVRGWVQRFNGPMIDITHPEQIEETGS